MLFNKLINLMPKRLSQIVTQTPPGFAGSERNFSELPGQFKLRTKLVLSFLEISYQSLQILAQKELFGYLFMVTTI